ncbi:hypothetical protein IMZ48_24045 [Candidatus Bathyarchaeota archaeon]|nr:hypothetical protein [Candidatus Bathyarchaeota archaeon]
MANHKHNLVDNGQQTRNTDPGDKFNLSCPYITLPSYGTGFYATHYRWPPNLGSAGSNDIGAMSVHRSKNAGGDQPGPAHIEVDSRCGICTGFTKIDETVLPEPS